MEALEILDPEERDGFNDKEEADGESGFTLQEVLRLGGTQVRERSEGGLERVRRVWVPGV